MIVREKDLLLVRARCKIILHNRLFTYQRLVRLIVHFGAMFV